MPWLQEFRLSQRILFDIESVRLAKVAQSLDAAREKVRELEACAARETQRRAEARTEYAAVLPPGVVAVLTDGDEAERRAEAGHAAAHGKYMDIILKFNDKLLAEEKRYKDR